MRFYVFFSCCILLLSKQLSSQEHGLGFYSHDVHKDFRTKLDLNPDGFFTLNDELELVFSFKLRPDIDMYFGYIARIIDDAGNNIDFIFDYRTAIQNSIKIVGRSNFTNLSINTNYENLINDWTELRLRFDAKRQSLTFYSPDSVLVATGMDLAKKVKILFGGNDHGIYRTTDVPPMLIRDIQIKRKGRLLHHFPLDESEGNTANDNVGGIKASVSHPFWLRSCHTFWKEEFSATLQGKVMFAFNPLDEEVFIVSDNQIVVYSVKDTIAKYAEVDMSTAKMIPGCQAFFDVNHKLLVCYNVDNKIVVSLDVSSPEIQTSDARVSSLTRYWHHNKFYVPSDSSLYIFGGYGQYEYKNLVQRYNFNAANWDTVNVSGEAYKPRYMSALGSLNDTIYILGGYGSETGNQMLNPTNFLDLMAFSIKDHSFSQLFEIHPPEEAIVFANSMIINPQTREYYALYLPFFQFDGYLQLIRGSLSDPGYEILGNRIPYLFHDTQSFADLYFCKTSGKMVAVTSYTENNNDTQVSIYSIAFPPNLYETETNTMRVSKELSPYKIFTFVFLILSLFGGLGYYAFSRRKRKQVTLVAWEGKQWRNTLLFFGGFQAFNKDQEDITAKFTPLIKELFLIIWFYSLKENKGISSETLIETLWFDSPKLRAKNNMAVNIARLKQLLTEFESASISRKTGYWKIDFEHEALYNDYVECMTIVRQRPANREHIIRIIENVNRGMLLQDLSFAWLDEFKAETSNFIIDNLMEYANSIDYKVEHELMIRIADSVFILDIVNEEAMVMKCKVMMHLGKHSMAKASHQKFANDYLALYAEPYKTSFQDIVNTEWPPR